MITKTTQKTRHHVDRLMTSPRVPVVNVKHAQKHNHYKITLPTYILLQLSGDTVFFAIKNMFCYSYIFCFCYILLQFVHYFHIFMKLKSTLYMQDEMSNSDLHKFHK